MEVELIRHPVGHRPVARLPGVGSVHHPDEHAHPIPCGQVGRGRAGIADAVVGLLQEKSLLGIHLLRLARRDPEKQRIELVDLPNEAAPAGIDAALLAWRRIKVLTPVPAIRRHLIDTALAVLQPLPQFAHVVGIGIASCQADDRNVGIARIPRRTVRHPGDKAASGDRFDRRADCLGRRGAFVRRCLIQPQQRHQLRLLRHDKMIGKRVDGLVFEEQRAVDPRQLVAQQVGQLHHQDRVDAVRLERLAGIDLLGPDLEQPTDHVLEIAHRLILEHGAGHLARRHRSDAPLLRPRSRDRRPLGRNLGRLRPAAPVLPDHPVALGNHDLLAEIVIGQRREMDVPIPFAFQHLLPLLRRERRASGLPQIRIAEQPPALEQTERQVGEQAVATDLVDHHQAVRFQCSLGVFDRPPQIRRRVQDIGGDHHVVAADPDALFRQRPVDIEQLIAEVRRARSVDLPGMHQERLGYVGVAVLPDVPLIGPQLFERPRTGAAGAGADLQEADRRLRRLFQPPPDKLDHRVEHHVVEEIGYRIVLINALDHGHRCVGEQNIRRRHPAGEHLRQHPQRRLGEDHLGFQAGPLQPIRPVRRPFGPERLECRRLGIGDAVRHRTDAALQVQVAALCQLVQALVDPAVVHRRQAAALLHLGDDFALAAKPAHLPQLGV